MTLLAFLARHNYQDGNENNRGNIDTLHVVKYEVSERSCKVEQ